MNEIMNHSDEIYLLFPRLARRKISGRDRNFFVQGYKLQTGWKKAD